MKKSYVKFCAWFAGWMLLFFTVAFVLKIIFFPAHLANAVVDAATNTTTGVINKTLNANNALFNYENFHNMYQGAKQQVININNAEQQINQLKQTFGEPTKWDKDTKAQYNLLLQNVDGYKMQYNRIVSDYNADSKKLNRDLFKDRSLPYELPLDYKQLQ